MTHRREVQAALVLLTRLPAGRLAAPPAPAQSAWAFPLVGALVGALMWAVFALATALGLPGIAAALLALAASALATGALHEDGLTDTADGFGGGATRAKKLEIMRDSRIGSYGVLALILVTALTAAAMAGNASLAGFLAIGAASRGAMLLPMAFLGPARGEGLGQGAALPADSRLAAGLALTVLLSLGAPSILLPVVAITLALMALAKRQIGGQTGDVLGAIQKLAECTAWLTLAA